VRPRDAIRARHERLVEPDDHVEEQIAERRQPHA
jgi:hypothetical protein